MSLALTHSESYVGLVFSVTASLYYPELSQARYVHAPGLSCPALLDPRVPGF